MATVNQMGIPGIGAGIWQPKLKNRWRVTFTNFGDVNTSTDVSMQAITIARPNISWDEVQLDRYNSRAWVAAKHTWSEMNLTVEDDIKSRAARAIQGQIQKQQYMTGDAGPWLAAAAEGSVYKFNTILEMLDGGDEKTVLERWDVESCWLKTVDYQDLDYASSEKVTIALTIRYDHARQSFGDYGGFGSALLGA